MRESKSINLSSKREAEWRTYSIYHVDKDLCVDPEESTGCLNSVMIRKDHINQMDPLVGGKGIVDRLLPLRFATTHEKIAE